MTRALLVVITVVVLGLSGCAGDAPEVPTGPDGEADPVLEVGREIYAARCASCHGTDGGGGQGPKLADGEVLEAYPDVEAQIELVTEGREGMPAFGDALDPEEIRAVVRYTREVL